MTRGIKYEEFPHGTQTGYWIHMKGSKDYPKSKPCEECKRAQRDAKRARYHRNKKLRGRPHMGTIIPAIGSKRRVEALMRLGHTAYDIADIAFPDKTSRDSAARLVYAIRQKPNVTYDTAIRINKAYRALQYKRGPSDKTARFASKHGYAAPGCWDGNEIDNPDARPQGVTPWTEAEAA